MSKGGGQGSAQQMQQTGFDMGGFGGGMPPPPGGFGDGSGGFSGQQEQTFVGSSGNNQEFTDQLTPSGAGGFAMQAPQQQLGFGSGPAMQAPQQQLGFGSGFAMQAPQQQLGFGSGPAMQAPQFSSPFAVQRQQQIAQRQQQIAQLPPEVKQALSQQRPVMEGRQFDNRVQANRPAFINLQPTNSDSPLLSQIALNNFRRNQGLEQAPIGGMPEGFSATPNPALGMNYTSDAVVGDSMFIYDQQTGERRTVKTEDVPALPASTGMPSPKLGTGTMFSGGNSNFDERTRQYRRAMEFTGGYRPPSPTQPVVDPSSGIRMGMGSKGGRGGGRGMSSGIAGKGGRDDRVYAGGNPNFDERTGRYRSPPFNPGGDKYYPLPVVEQPRRTPSIPSRNTQFQMPYFGSPYGRMKPYEGRFSGYGVPTNMLSFAQPHYQPYVPRSYSPPPPSMSLPPGENGPLMQFPPSQNSSTFGGGRFAGGYGGIGGFGRYNLGLAGSQLR
jgi:hypothetical protein